MTYKTEKKRLNYNCKCGHDHAWFTLLNNGYNEKCPMNGCKCKKFKEQEQEE